MLICVLPKAYFSENINASDYPVWWFSNVELIMKYECFYSHTAARHTGMYVPIALYSLLNVAPDDGLMTVRNM